MVVRVSPWDTCLTLAPFGRYYGWGGGGSFGCQPFSYIPGPTNNNQALLHPGLLTATTRP